MLNTNNSCPCGYSIDEINCDKCIECFLFPCSYYEDSVDIFENDQAYDIGYSYDPEYTDEYPNYYNSFDDIDEIAWENEQRELHYGGQSEFRDHWTLDE